MKENNPFYTDFIGKNTDRTATKDRYGNVSGNQYDLARDNAFAGKTIAVLHLYTGEGFDFRLPEFALKEKGFEVFRWQNSLPTLEDFKKVLAKSSQLWIISTSTQLLNNSYLSVIKDFFNHEHGLFIWGDNSPYYVDANFVSKNLFNSSMSGCVTGDHIVSLQKGESQAGIVPGHVITTGLEFLYEGITIATISPNKDLKPLMYGSAGNLVTACYDKGGKRAIIDGGFTRLYMKWDTAGTARFVKNAAAWLANVERFDLKSERTNNVTPDGNKPKTAQPNKISIPDTKTITAKWSNQSNQTQPNEIKIPDTELITAKWNNQSYQTQSKEVSIPDTKSIIDKFK